MKDTAIELFAVIGALGTVVVVVFLTAVAVYPIYGFVLAKLWLWFVVPVFGLPQLSMAQALGLAIVVGFMTDHREGNESKDKDKGAMVVFVARLLSPLIVLSLGWIVKCFL